MRFSLFIGACFLAACAPDSSEAPSPAPPPEQVDVSSPATMSVVTQVRDHPRLQTLTRLIDAAGLTETFADTALTFTLFAPSDDAFAALGDQLDDLESDPDVARVALLNHVLPTRMLSGDVFPDLSIETEGGREISFVEVGEGLAVTGIDGRARITEADLEAGNGTIHVIDAVLATD